MRSLDWRCIRYKVALIEALKLHWAERDRLQQEQAELAAAGAEQPASAAVAGSSQAAATAAAGSNSQAGGLIAVRSAPPAPAPPVLANVQQLEAEEAAEVRGVCDGCGQNVMSNDEGRKREGSTYYHEACVKGLCGGCGRIVHANADRAKLSGVYWHRDCL
jgi:hypothetical protein